MWSSLWSDLAPAAARARSLHILEKSRFRERQAAVVGDDHVIEHADVDQLQGFAQPARHQLVGLAGLGDAGGMLGFISRCHHHLFGWVQAVYFRTLRVAPASVRGE